MSTSDRFDVTVTVNGRKETKLVEARTLLIDLIRDELRLTGSHVGCEEGWCGACTVELDERTVKSCLLFAWHADGRHINTIEGVAPEGELDAVQRSFTEENGLQCGFCTPGMVLSTRSLLREHPDPTEEQIKDGLSGNLCRCTGYAQIIAAVKRAAEVSRKEHSSISETTTTARS